MHNYFNMPLDEQSIDRIDHKIQIIKKLNNMKKTIKTYANPPFSIDNDTITLCQLGYNEDEDGGENKEMREVMTAMLNKAIQWHMERIQLLLDANKATYAKAQEQSQEAQND